jgi:spore maturation protein CgeB
MSTRRERRAIVLAPEGNLDLLGSYGRALEAQGFAVTWWSLDAALNRNVRGGRLGRLFAGFVNVEPWVNKANRELIVLARRLQVDLVLAAGAAPLRAGALAQIGVSVPTAKTVLLWPDPLQNLSPPVAQALGSYDLVASYSRFAVGAMERLGARKVIWLPFAADPKAFPPDVMPTDADRARFACDVVFVGNYRPEREQAVNALYRAGLRVKVFGEKTWLRFARDRALVTRYFQGRPLFGDEMVRAIKSSRICLNVIDDTNYPAANMRSFEGPTCGGAMLQSRCPELEPFFPDGRASEYFDGEDELVAKARSLVENAEHRMALAAEAHRIVMRDHTYLNRTQEMLRALGLEA